LYEALVVVRASTFFSGRAFCLDVFKISNVVYSTTLGSGIALLVVFASSENLTKNPMGLARCKRGIVPKDALSFCTAGPDDDSSRGEFYARSLI